MKGFVMTDSVEEEQEIMEERARDPKQVSGSVLDEPIRRLFRRPAESIDRSATVRTAIEVMQAHRFGSVLITHRGVLVGIVTERDILMKVAGGPESMLDLPVSEIMTPDPETLHADDPVVFLMNKMHVGGFRHVPVLAEDGTPLHVVSVRDVMRFLLGELEPAVVNVPSEPYRGEPKRHSA